MVVYTVTGPHNNRSSWWNTVAGTHKSRTSWWNTVAKPHKSRTSWWNTVAGPHKSRTSWWNTVAGPHIITEPHNDTHFNRTSWQCFLILLNIFKPLLKYFFPVYCGWKLLCREMSNTPPHAVIMFGSVSLPCRYFITYDIQISRSVH